MFLRKRVCSAVLICIFLCLCFVCSVSAVTITIDNNGNPRDNPYGKATGVPASFDGVDYVDCYIPYAKTIEEIGGYAVSVTNDQFGYGPMPGYAKKYRAGDHANYEDDYTKVAGKTSTGYESDTGMALFKDANGTTYYSSAIQKFFYNDPKNGFFGWSTNNRGQIFDVILTNGVTIHFIVGDANAEAHTNGWYGGYVSEGNWVCNKINYKQYTSLFSLVAGNCLELWGRTSDVTNTFMKKYGLRNDGSGVHVAYYRMYNAKYTDSPKRASGVPSSVAYSPDGTVQIVDSTSDGGASESESNDSVNMDKVPPENALVGMKGLDLALSDNQKSIDLPTGKALTASELSSRDTVKAQREYSWQQRVTDMVRIFIVFIGLCLLLYMIVLLVAYAFDRSNILVNVCLLRVVSFGIIDPDEDEETGKLRISTKRVLQMVIVLFIVGSVLVSGVALGWVEDLVVWLSGLM